MKKVKLSLPKQGQVVNMWDTFTAAKT